MKPIKKKVKVDKLKIIINGIYKFLINFFLKYPTPGNLNYLWNFGVLSLIFFLVQLITGFLLSTFYTSSSEVAFFSIENIMRNINQGWLVRYNHSNGASFFFIMVYLHIFRNLYYKTFLRPRIFIWQIGIIILFIMIITAFTGYVLPWGQMSFWAATVITNLFSAIPFFGLDIVIWLWGDYNVSAITLSRFFSLHFLLPFTLIYFIFIHFIFLHKKGSSNPLNIRMIKDKFLFHPYFTWKDSYTILLQFSFNFFLIGFCPNLLSHSDNYIPANSLVTPTHIVPEWYFSIFYAILRAIPSKLGGIWMLICSLIILFILPFIFEKFYILFNFKMIRVVIWRYLIIISKYAKWLKDFFLYLFEICSYQYYYYTYIRFWKTINDILFSNFVYICVFLSILGSYSAEGIYLILSRIFMLFYFAYFILLFFFNFQQFFQLEKFNFIYFFEIKDNRINNSYYPKLWIGRKILAVIK